jgi:hypothetical protein
MLLAGALFCIEWSIPWFSALGVERRDFLRPGRERLVFQRFDCHPLVGRVST